MTIEIERFPYPFNDDNEEKSDVKGWVVSVASLGRVIDTPVAQNEGIWMSVRDKETGEYIDPERFGLFIRYKKEAVASEEDSTVFIWYGGDPEIKEEDGDGWFDDFPPIPPGP